MWMEADAHGKVYQCACEVVVSRMLGHLVCECVFLRRLLVASPAGCLGGTFFFFLPYTR